MNMMKDGLQDLRKGMKAKGSESIDYERIGAGKITGLLVVIGESRFESLDRDGAVVETKSKDFIISQSDLVIAGEATTPQRNDVIRQTINGKVIEYRSLPDPGLPHYRETDGYGTAFRIHTKETL